ncbi:MAG: hypothetical protein ACLR0U_26540 [Enterocloster clostridioformis]
MVEPYPDEFQLENCGIQTEGFLTQSSKDITHIVMLVLLIIAFSSLYGPCSYPSPYTNQCQILYRMMEEGGKWGFSVQWTTYHSSDEFGHG